MAIVNTYANIHWIVAMAAIELHSRFPARGLLISNYHWHLLGPISEMDTEQWQAAYRLSPRHPGSRDTKMYRFK